MLNEEAALPELFVTLVPVLRGMALPFEILCIDDGSCDGTLAHLLKMQETLPELRILELSRRFGKEVALSAGLDHARGAAVIPFDADLQDPPEILPSLVAKWREGYDVVLAKRRSRGRDGAVKRLTAWAYYRTHNILADIDIPADVGDFRLMDRSVVQALRRLPERRRFMKGLFAWVGFRTAVVEYDRRGRSAGTSAWSLWRLWQFALEGITSFSTLPLRFWSYAGFIIAFLALLYGAFVILRTLIYGVDVPGYASLLATVLFLGGLQLLSLGLLGEYVGRIYGEVKQRPLYLIRRRYEGDGQMDNAQDQDHDHDRG